MTLALDLVVVSLILMAALWAIAAREVRDAVIALVALGLLLSLAWMRLSAIDVALTEAAVGGGATGLVLLRASGELARHDDRQARLGPAAAVAVGTFCAALAAGLSAVVLDPPVPPPSLAVLAAGSMSDVGLENPVTVVLLAYRAIDTLMEKVVLVLALVGV
jgi:uncharacterized MnhB-related membrane protein